MMRRGVVVATVAVALLFLSGTSSAWGHASQVSSTPAAGESLADLPSEIVITFDSAIMAAGLAVAVRDPSGAIVAGTQPSVVQNEVRVGLPVDQDASGTFAVAYRAVSEDGHTITGRFDFTVLGDVNPAGVVVSAEPTMSADTPAQGVGQDVNDASTGVSVSPIILGLLVLATIGLALALRWRGGNRIR